MSKELKYNHSTIEKKWQEEWLDKRIYEPDLIKAKTPFYNLMMFPYPSAEGLHVGNVYAFTGADIFGRFNKMQGKDVFEPIGLDGFGIHSENYAIKIGRHPAEQSKISEKHFYKQLHMIGNSYDWSHTLETYDPAYYRWTQWLFVQMYKAGLAYKDEATVNWCPLDKTVLADEQVLNGKCERCGSVVTKRKMSSWFFRITKYADHLLEGIEKIDWPEKIKTAQRNWIGKSEGMLITFKVEGGEDIEVFTTRPDTLNAVTFLATSKLYKKSEEKEKIGKFSGKCTVDPLSGRKIPVWDTNYVTPDYGTGIIMGVPAHDERDMEFAKKYHLDIIQKEPDQKLWELIEEKGWGKRVINYHLRDWLISRQRYWGPPIPMINCKDCGWQPVPEEDLPVLLPEIKDFKPKGDGTSPLHNASDSWKKVKCPKCGRLSERELDVSDTFLDSSWYFLRYPSLHSESADKLSFDPEITKKWLPVDTYIGGAEHAVLHLLYARFVTMVLKDLGYLNFEEPFPFLFGHGLIIKDGAKMSKSKGNIVNPDEYIAKFGADTLRLYLMFLGPFDQGGDFRDTGMEGMQRFLNRVWKLFGEARESNKGIDPKVQTKLHQTIKGVTEDVGQFKYNTAIAKIMELVNVFTEYRVSSVEHLKPLALLLAPFAPHLAEEVWVEVLKQPFSVHQQAWPEYDSKYLKEDQVTIIIQVNGKVRATLSLKSQMVRQAHHPERSRGISNLKSEVEDLAKKDAKIAKWLKGKTIKKMVFVPGRLVNFVV
jgi:leucyl-tRNA synthetase